MGFYSTMKLARCSSLEQIRQQWRFLSRELHPDRNNGSAEATAAFADLSAAYACLSDPSARRVYDAQLKLGCKCSHCNSAGQLRKQRGFSEAVYELCSLCGGEGYAVLPQARSKLKNAK